MCFTLRGRKNKKKKYKKKIYPYKNYENKNYNNITTEEFIKECITCYNCKKIFTIGSEEIKIHCAGCNNFFHCGIAGKCRGKNCNSETMLGTKHRLSWCVSCVPDIEGNEEKNTSNGTCICKNCIV